MNRSEIVESLRAEITMLQRVLDLMLDTPSVPVEIRRRGRPAGSRNKVTNPEAQAPAPKRRTMSPEGKARIAAAQKKRWAGQKKTAAAGSGKPPSVTSPKREGKVASAGSVKQTMSPTKKAAKPAKPLKAAAKKASTKAAKKPAAKRIPKPAAAEE